MKTNDTKTVHLANFAGKDVGWSLFLMNFIKTRFQPRWFPVKFAKILRATILKNICVLRTLQEELLNWISRFFYFNVYRQSIFLCYKKMHVMSQPKFQFLFSKERLLNKWNEIILKCRRENKRKLRNYKTKLNDDKYYIETNQLICCATMREIDSNEIKF